MARIDYDKVFKAGIEQAKVAEERIKRDLDVEYFTDARGNSYAKILNPISEKTIELPHEAKLKISTVDSVPDINHGPDIDLKILNNLSAGELERFETDSPMIYITKNGRRIKCIITNVLFGKKVVSENGVMRAIGAAELLDSKKDFTRFINAVRAAKIKESEDLVYNAKTNKISPIIRKRREELNIQEVLEKKREEFRRMYSNTVGEYQAASVYRINMNMFTDSSTTISTDYPRL